jgi:methionyl-tRNA formyltransferase
MAPPPVAEMARRLGLDLLQAESVNSDASRAQIAAKHPEVLCLSAFGALIKDPLLSEYPILNVHPSLLPRWRGAAPIERAIMAGDARTGVSIMRLTAGLDSGPLCIQASEPIQPQDTYGTLVARLQELGAQLLVRALDEQPECTPQDESHATYAEKILPVDRRLDPSEPAAALERVVRALTPHIGAYVELPDGGTLGVREARVVDEGPPTGELSLGGPRPVLGCAEGALELLVVHPSGRRPTSAEDYLRGLRK